MLGQLNTQDKRATVIGAGISGLLAAEALARAGYEVSIHGKGPVGGLISTLSHPRGLAEAAAHSVQATPAVQALCMRLGVELLPVRENARYIWRWNRLCRFPLTIWETIKLLARAYVALSPGDGEGAAPDLAAWARRHLGEAPARYLITPMVRGIFGARAEEISVARAFPRLAVPRGHSLLSYFVHRWRTRAPKPPRGPMMAPRGGMGELARALEARLRASPRVSFRDPSDGPPDWGAPNVLVCTSAPDAADLLADRDPATARALREVVYTPLVTVTVFAEKRAFPASPRGVGVLFPEATSRRALGILFNSSAFEGRVLDEETVSLTWMAGGSTDPAMLERSDAELEQLVRSDLEAVFRFAPGARLETVVRRWPRAVPKYDEALAGVWRKAQEGWCSTPGHILLGNYTGQVSVRGLITTCDSLGS
jgi:oxygen-dependent protoporphyrinogen oxidase